MYKRVIKLAKTFTKRIKRQLWFIFSPDTFHLEALFLAAKEK